MDPAILKKLNAARARREPVVLVNELATGRVRLVHLDDQVPGELGLWVTRAFETEKPVHGAVGDHAYFINPYVPPVRIILIGAVHISQALAPMAQLAGYDVELVDPRSAFTKAERFTDVSISDLWPAEYFAAHALDQRCALVALTHDPKIDDGALLAALQTDCFYIGALGSGKSHAKRLERLAEKVADESSLGRIKGPVGLDIGAANPAEIAVAILAEIILARRGAKRV